MEFDNYNDLLSFVLKECGEMYFMEEVMFDVKLGISVRGHFDVERFCYATQLVKEKFGLTINKLFLIGENIDMEDGWLNKTEIVTLKIRSSNIKLPKLPKTLTYIELYYPDKFELYKIKKYHEDYYNLNIHISPDIGREKDFDIEFHTLEEAQKYIRENI